MKKLASLLIILLAGCATGTTMITGAKREPVSEELVKVYSSGPGDQYLVIGKVSARGEAFSDQAAQDAAIAELKKRAGEIGANGIVIQQMYGSTFGNRSMISAEAIYRIH